MKKNCFLIPFALILLAACSSPVTKKVLIVGKGKLTVTENSISMNNGSGHVEETVEVRGDQPVTYDVTTPSGKNTITIPQEGGFYLVNLKTDTLVGSQQILGTDISSGKTITQEELKVKIDSLTKLTTGQNVSAASHTFFILPNQVTKVSSNMDAKVFGPFTKISSSIEADKDGKAPEIFKFYTNNEMRTLIDNFKKMTY